MALDQSLGVDLPAMPGMMHTPGQAPPPAPKVAPVATSAVAAPAAPAQPTAADFYRQNVIPHEQQLVQAQQGVGQSEAELANAKLMQENEIAASKSRAADEYAAAVQANEAKAKKEDWPDPAFHPTQENIQSLGSIFSLIATAGVMLGGAGKMSGIGAMNAMGGMLKGWQEGRKDLWEREKQTFDAELKALESHRKRILQELESGNKVAATNREAAAMHYEVAARLAGSQSIIAAQIRNANYKGAVDTLNGVLKIENKLYETQQKNEQENLKLKYQRETQIKVAKIHAAATIAAKQSTSATDRFGFGDIVATASNEAAASLGNLVQMPYTVTTGIFGGRTTTSLFTAPVDVLANHLTAEDTQRYNAEINNLGKFIAQIQKGGRNVTNGDIETSSKAFAIREGDSALTAFTHLAMARQALERALDVRLASPNTPPTLKEVYRANKASIQAAVPYTVSDINKFANARDKNTTFAQYAKDYGISSSGDQVHHINGDEEYNQLPSGAEFVGPDGVQRRKP